MSPVVPTTQAASTDALTPKVVVSAAIAIPLPPRTKPVIAKTVSIFLILTPSRLINYGVSLFLSQLGEADNSKIAP
jgi:hypothetical protein